MTSPNPQMLHPLAEVCQLSAITVPQFSEAMVQVLWAFALGGMITVFFGGALSHFFFVYLLRLLPSWCRFDRALSRLFRRAGR